MGFPLINWPCARQEAHADAQNYGMRNSRDNECPERLHRELACCAVIRGIPSSGIWASVQKRMC